MEARSSAVWWAEVKRSEALLFAWLGKQYHGELTAAERIERYCLERLPPSLERWRPALLAIAAQERAHAEWVGGLLRVRGGTPARREREERYWSHTLGAIRSFEEAAAVAAHAERMRLERIATIARDPEAPSDIREVFGRILREEEFHARAFRAMAGEELFEAMREGHERGAEAIGFLSMGEAL